MAITNVLSVVISVPLYFWLSDYLGIANLLLFVLTLVVVLIVSNGVLFLSGMLDNQDSF